MRNGVRTEALTGRPYWWIWMILVGSYPRVAVYVVTQILPELGKRSARTAGEPLRGAHARSRTPALRARGVPVGKLDFMTYLAPHVRVEETA